MLLERLGLDETQIEIVKQIQHNMLVSAGAGTGKTRTLVARYLWLLQHEVPPRQVLAITFTEKAAREMRNRVRQEIGKQIIESPTVEERRMWSELETVMDAARIGTIHSFCAELLRSHPAEACIDPLFEVVDESMAATIRAQVVEDTLAWATADEKFRPLFLALKPERLRSLLSHLLDHRLEGSRLLESEDLAERSHAALVAALEMFLQDIQVLDAVAQLRAMAADGSLFEDAGGPLQSQVVALLEGWHGLELELAGGSVVSATQVLFRLRRSHMSLNLGKKVSQAKQLVGVLREKYATLIDPWLGGAKADDPPPEAEIEQLSDEVLPLVGILFRQAAAGYRSILDQRQALDFDDLEAGALRLIENQRIRSLSQEKISRILVDEFQDTNARQRDIIDALTGGEPGRLFIVGDARQSIYRFRGADVRVFILVQQDIRRRGGTTANLNKTFRSPNAILRALDDLLPPIMGSGSSPARPFQVPYTPLKAQRMKPRPGVEPPLVEFALGTGEGAERARKNTAGMLTSRLHQLRASGQIRSWDEVALLFRASSGFAKYEDALQEAGIPYVTVAGRGFYDRPEIRDVLNVLKALANPLDDLAMAGLLRSPAIGLKDSTLYILRRGPNGPRPLLAALSEDLPALDEQERGRINRAREFMQDLVPLVDRLPVSELLKLVVDRLDYRAVLAAGHSRLWRNLDKLQADAYASGAVQVRAFLEYLRSLRDVGVRVGEAPAIAEGAIRLMTIHKAKGLEFDFVVIADASWRPRSTAAPLYLLEETGPALRFDRLEASPLIYRLASAIDGQQAQAESGRLLYVASTRAREKLIISGHLSITRSGVRVDGWLKALLEAMGENPSELAQSSSVRETTLPGGETVRLWIGQEGIAAESEPPEKLVWPESKSQPLFDHRAEPEEDQADPDLDEWSPPDWRATGELEYAPAVAVGKMVHAAVQAWLFPGDSQLDSILRTTALREGVVDPGQLKLALEQSYKLLKRLRGHSHFAVIESAAERAHEVPYTLELAGGRIDSGIIDLLYRSEDGWHLIDFKTDFLDTREKLEEAMEEHRPQIARYVLAINRLLGVQPKASICFLDALGEAEVVEI